MKKYSSSILSILAGILLVMLAYRLDLWSYHLRPSVSELDFSPGEQAAWMLPAYLADALLAVGAGRGVPLLAILFGLPVGWFPLGVVL